jgi:hypothetical protein
VKFDAFLRRQSGTVTGYGAGPLSFSKIRQIFNFEDFLILPAHFALISA